MQQAVRKILVSTILATLFLCSCRPRSNKLSFKDGLDEILDLSKADLETRIDVCSRNIFVAYVGNAEGLGRYVLTPAARQQFSARDLLAWEALEEQREEEYFSVIKAQVEALIRRLSSANKPCTDTLGEIAKRGLKPGSVFLVSLTDGPSHSGQKDSRLRTITFAFRNGKWGQQVPQDWTLLGKSVSPLPHGQDLEVLVPRDLKTVLDWAFVRGQSEWETSRPFDHAIYLMKSHGGKTVEPWGSTAGPPIAMKFMPQTQANGSVFMFDRNDENGLRQQSDYVLPIWTPLTICSLLIEAKDQELKDCIAKLTSGIKVSFQQVGLEKGKSTQGAIDDTQGPNKVEEQGDSRTQGFVDLELKINPFEISPLSALTIGPAMMHDATQGVLQSDVVYGFGSTFLHRNQVPKEMMPPYDLHSPFKVSEIDNLRMALKEFKTYPEGFRFLGDGLSIGGAEGGNALTLKTNLKHPTLLLLDTCSSSVSGRFDFERSFGADSKVIILSNPNPLLINAVKYNVIDAFQQSWMVDIFNGAGSDGKATDYEIATSSKIQQKLLIAPRLVMPGSEIPFSRLKVNIIHCRDSLCENRGFANALFTHQQILSSLSYMGDFLEKMGNKGSVQDYLLFHYAATKFFNNLVDSLFSDTIGFKKAEDKYQLQILRPYSDTFFEQRKLIILALQSHTMAENGSIFIHGLKGSKPAYIQVVAFVWLNLVRDIIAKLQTANSETKIYESLMSEYWEDVFCLHLVYSFVMFSSTKPSVGQAQDRTKIKLGTLLNEEAILRMTKYMVHQFDAAMVVNPKSPRLAQLKPFMERLKLDNTLMKNQDFSSNLMSTLGKINDWIVLRASDARH